MLTGLLVKVNPILWMTTFHNRRLFLSYLICTEQTKYEESLKELNSSFLKRGYQQHQLTDQFAKAAQVPKDDLLKYKQIENSENQIPFITTFNNHLPNIKQIIDKH